MSKRKNLAMAPVIIAVLGFVLVSLTSDSALASGPVIVLDPGHSGTSITTVDSETQIVDREYPNMPEMLDVFEVTTILKAKLEAAGYTVFLTKQAYTDTVTKRERTNVANDNHAALAVSIHTSGHTFSSYGEIYAQRLDGYREDVNGNRVYFGLPDVAALSQRYGDIFLRERRKIEGPSVIVTVNSGFGARGLAPGNLPIVQLWSRVPWVYCEAGVPQNDLDREMYAQSLYNSITASVPIENAPPPRDDTSAPVRYEETDDRIVLGGTWSRLGAVGCSGGSYQRTCSGSSSATIRFDGTYLAWVTTAGYTLSRAFVSLDGGPAESIDLYRPSTERQQKVWETGELAPGVHTVKIWRDPSDRAGKYIGLDAVDVVGTLLAPLPPPPPAVSVVFSNPGDGAVLKYGVTYTINVTATGAVKVVFYVDGRLFKTDTSSPFSCSFRSSTKGTRTFKAIAYSKSGATATATATFGVR